MSTPVERLWDALEHQAYNKNFDWTSIDMNPSTVQSALNVVRTRGLWALEDMLLPFQRVDPRWPLGVAYSPPSCGATTSYRSSCLLIRADDPPSTIDAPAPPSGAGTPPSPPILRTASKVPGDGRSRRVAFAMDVQYVSGYSIRTPPPGRYITLCVSHFKMAYTYETPTRSQAWWLLGSLLPEIETFVTVQKWSITPDGVTGIFSDYYGQTVYTVWDQDAFKYCLPLIRKDVVRVRGYLKRLDYPTAATRSTVVPTAVFVSTFAWIEVKAEGPRPLGGAELFLSSIRATRALSAHLKVSLEARLCRVQQHFIHSVQDLESRIAAEDVGMFDDMQKVPLQPGFSERAYCAKYLLEAFQAHWDQELRAPVTLKRLLRDAARPILLLGFDDPCWVVVRAISGMLNTESVREAMDDDRMLVYFN